MLRVYYEAFAGSTTVKGERNYAIYIKKLLTLAEEEDRDPRPDKRVVQMLAQIKDQYRNPLVTPEAVIEVEEAAQLFGMASTLIALMARQIQTQRPAAAGNGKGTNSEESSDSDNFPMAQAS
jgi:hypothetical protein